MTRKLNGICMHLFYIFGVLMIVMDMNIGKIKLFSLTTEEKCYYAQLKLDEKTDYW